MAVGYLQDVYWKRYPAAENLLDYSPITLASALTYNNPKQLLQRRLDVQQLLWIFLVVQF